MTECRTQVKLNAGLNYAQALKRQSRFSPKIAACFYGRIINTSGREKEESIFTGWNVLSFRNFKYNVYIIVNIWGFVCFLFGLWDIRHVRDFYYVKLHNTMVVILMIQTVRINVVYSKELGHRWQVYINAVTLTLFIKLFLIEIEHAIKQCSRTIERASISMLGNSVLLFLYHIIIIHLVISCDQYYAYLQPQRIGVISALSAEQSLSGL